MSDQPVFLFTYANDSGHSLDLPTEWRATEKMLARLHDTGCIEYNISPSTTKEDVWDKCNRFHSRMAIFHYGGHSNSNGLDLTDALLSGEHLAQLLGQEPQLKLAFLNGCSNDAQVQQLLDSGVPAVIATSAYVSNQEASQLAQQFYAALASGRTIHQAFTVAAAFVNDAQEEIRIEKHRIGTVIETESASFPWGLYYREDKALEWTIPSPVPSEQVNNKHFHGTPTTNKNDEGVITFFHTPFPRPTATDPMIGRQTELNQVRELFSQNQSPVVLSGMGGLGKTRLAIAYANAYYEEYPYLVWFEQEGDLYSDLKAFVTSFPDLMKALSYEPSKDLELDVKLILSRLGQLEGLLLIIDNTDEQIANLTDALPKAPRAHVLLTSRAPLDHVATPLALDFLPAEAAKELFYTHYRRERADAVVEHILETIDYHTLTVELLAKTAANRKISLPKLQQLLEERGLKLGRRADGVRILHNSQQKLQRIFPFLQAVFDLGSSNLEPAEKELLTSLAALPSLFIPLAGLADLLGVAEDNEDDWDDLTFHLEQLVNKGWLNEQIESTESIDGTHSTTTEVYKMHRVIQDTVWAQLKPDVNQLEPLIERVVAMLKVDEDKDNPVDKFPLMPYGERLLSLFAKEQTSLLAKLRNVLADLFSQLGQYAGAQMLYEEALAYFSIVEDAYNLPILQSNLAIALRALGNYEGAKRLLEKALASDLKNFGPDHQSIAIHQSNLASVLQNLGDDEGAKRLLEKALASNLKNFGPDHQSTAISQSNLAVVLKALDDNEGAKCLLEKALASAEKNLDPDHPSIATRQSNLAMVLKALDDNEGAKCLLEKALASAEKNFDPDHPSIATRQSNLATILEDLRDYEGAKHLLEKALASDLKKFGLDHRRTVIRQTNLGSLYYQLADYRQAKSLFSLAYETLLQKSGIQHPNTIAVGEWLEDVKIKLNESNDA